VYPWRESSLCRGETKRKDSKRLKKEKVLFFAFLSGSCGRRDRHGSVSRYITAVFSVRCVLVHP
jgi:hypothetical protein